MASIVGNFFRLLFIKMLFILFGEKFFRISMIYNIFLSSIIFKLTIWTSKGTKGLVQLKEKLVPLMHK